MENQAEPLVHAEGTRGQGATPSAVPYRSPAERRAAGKALRDAVPRVDQSGWKPPSERRDPVEIVLAANEGRLVDLVPIRHGRIAQSPFAFFVAPPCSWPPTWPTSHSGLRVQACGDAHLSNFEAFATPERDLIFDINDLDETLPAPWEWDVKRLTASVVLAGRYIQLTQRESERAARAAVRSDRHHMGEYAFMKALDIWYDKIDLTRLLDHFDPVPEEESLSFRHRSRSPCPPLTGLAVAVVCLAPGTHGKPRQQRCGPSCSSSSSHVRPRRPWTSAGRCALHVADLIQRYTAETIASLTGYAYTD